MEDNVSTGLKRNMSFSRRVSMLAGPNLSGKYNRIVFAVIVLILGFVSGNLVYRLFLKVSDVNEPIQNRKRHNIHEPPDSRPGISIKKDLSIQFRDYIPRYSFITTGNWYNQRESLKLFLQTYPDAWKFDLYCILEDESHKIFFTPFHKLNIVQSKIVIDESKGVYKSGSNETYKNATHMDFGAWIIATFHQDDYLVLRMENANETFLAKQLEKMGALEWIDKYYTTSRDNDTQSVYHEVFQKLNIPLFVWYDEELTYSDFMDVNHLSNSKDTTSVITQCGFYDQFLLIMYVPFVSKQAIYSLEVLQAFAALRFMQTAVFLSKDFFHEHKMLTESLIHVTNVGILIQNSSYPRGKYVYNKIRNDVVEVGRIIKHFDSNQEVIKYALCLDISSKVAKKLSEERFIYVFKDVLNISHLIPKYVVDNIFKFENIKRKHGQIIALDLTNENAELLMVYLLKKYGASMVSINECEL